MDLQWSYEETDGYLHVRAAGDWTTEDVRRAIDDIAKTVQAKGHARILVDMRDMSPPASEFERYLAGEHVAEVWGPLNIKVAAVWRQDLITKFVENVAVNRGANLAVLSDLNEATRWLMA